MIIDTENLNGLTLQEVALLLLLYDSATDGGKAVHEVRDIDIVNTFNVLKLKGYVVSSIYSEDRSYTPPYCKRSWFLVKKGKEALADNCVQDRRIKKAALDRASILRCDALAPKLQELFPLGKKPGTNLMWRGSTKVVSDRLQKILLQGAEFTDEEAIEATKAYIAGFNGIYTTMRILPYFIFKNEVRAGEVEKSRDFMAYIEDLRSNPQNESVKEWNVELK